MPSLLRTAALALPLAFAMVTGAFAQPAMQNDSTAQAILDEVNFARMHPQDYARRLLLQPVSNWEAQLGAAGDHEDEGAYAEAVDFLMRQSPLPALSADDVLAASALEHVSEQGPEGAIGHDSASGESFDNRIRRHGATASVLAENIAYGPRRPADVVRELIIDRGVASRGHRRNIFSAQVQAAGVKCGPHKDYDTMCVMDFAGSPQRNAGWSQAALDTRPSRTPFF